MKRNIRKYIRKTWKRFKNVIKCIFKGALFILLFPFLIINSMIFPLEYVFLGRNEPFIFSVYEWLSDHIVINWNIYEDYY